MNNNVEPDQDEKKGFSRYYTEKNKDMITNFSSNHEDGKGLTAPLLYSTLAR